ncbi:alpha/beta fold hydrolase [Ruegeria sp. HKCCD7255]|uniref:alpha/beta fold hydrolase n=1 Tax=Ruegeria sp. HKCCD7255 TaxID=2683004 RepID=UPI001488ADD3|nr:alpha/beta hydrolase [Ruegeria sp. HKCCD7255]
MRGFTGFVEETVDSGAVELFVRHNATPQKPALLLLHGYPQTSAMWHLIAPFFAEDYHVICPDLRGYGRSEKPASQPDHSSYSKRAMAQDIVGVLDHFGYETSLVCGHDRGGRVAHRLGLDHPDRVRALTVLDIAPTREMYANTTEAFARAYWHWFFLILPSPQPERMIEADPRAFWLGKNTRQAGGGTPYHPDALEEYLSTFEDPDCIRATCEDYRAAASIDIDHDNADCGRKLAMPVLALWANQGAIGRCFDPLALWRLRADTVQGTVLDATHYMAEEIPDQIAELMLAFFKENG